MTVAASEGVFSDKAIMASATPRRITDLIGSLCDLTSGSGDKGTPVVLVQGYFDNLTDCLLYTSAQSAVKFSSANKLRLILK